MTLLSNSIHCNMSNLWNCFFYFVIFAVLNCHDKLPMFPNSWLLVQETRLGKTFSVQKGTVQYTRYTVQKGTVQYTRYSWRPFYLKSAINNQQQFFLLWNPGPFQVLKILLLNQQMRKCQLWSHATQTERIKCLRVMF